jgi:LmbE family N-acetylglucosaminyl deacetylase
MSGKNRIMILAPHTDDGEFGCGGTIAKMIEGKKEVFYVAFSHAEKSVPKGFANDVLVSEMREATKLLGIPDQNVITFDYSVRDFPLHRQDILENMVYLERQIKPDMILLPSINDTHQDHLTVAQEGFRAFKKNTMLGYEIPWNNLTFNTTCFVFLERRHVEKKVEALKCYKSQLDRAYANEDFIYSLATARGTQIGATYAEAFDLMRWVIV